MDKIPAARPNSRGSGFSYVQSSTFPTDTTVGTFSRRNDSCSDLFNRWFQSTCDAWAVHEAKQASAPAGFASPWGSHPRGGTDGEQSGEHMCQRQCQVTLSHGDRAAQGGRAPGREPFPCEAHSSEGDGKGDA